MTASRKTVFGFGSERDAAFASSVLNETPGLEALPLVLLDENGQWFLECYDGGDLSGVLTQALGSAGIAAQSVRIAAVPDLDWVSESQRSLPSVHAGRFLVHGSHDRSRAFSQWAIEIDAGRAFGTAHHGTTKGCLLAIARLPAATRPQQVLDLGTGSGVLAIAAAKAFRHRAIIAASDIDPIAVAVARENCRKNGALGCIRLSVGNGFKPAYALKRGAFAIVMANILAKPLLKLAPRLRELTAPGGILILSGLLSSQAREILARYRATGFTLMQRRDLESWATLTLRRVY